MSKEFNLSAIPIEQCKFAAEVEVSKNSETSKSAKFKLKARSNEPIKHPMWGTLVHDMSGMKLNKNRISVDYNHDPNQIIGYANKFSVTDYGLEISGALTPWKDSDRASEIAYKLGEGVPYQASINFGGEPLKLQIIEEGEVAEVNDKELNGPAVIVREWPLRNVAITPIGADENTEANLLSGAKNKTIVAEIVDEKGEIVMSKSDTELNAEVEETELNAEVEETELNADTEAVETEEEVEAEETPAEEVAEETEEVVDAAEEAETEAKEEVVEAPEEAVALSDERKEFKLFVEAFGTELAAEYFASNMSLEEAKEQQRIKLLEENKQLKSQLGQAPIPTGEDAPVSLDPAEEPSEVSQADVEKYMLAGMTEAQAKHAAALQVVDMGFKIEKV